MNLISVAGTCVISGACTFSVLNRKSRFQATHFVLRFTYIFLVSRLTVCLSFNSTNVLSKKRECILLKWLFYYRFQFQHSVVFFSLSFFRSFLSSLPSHFMIVKLFPCEIHSFRFGILFSEWQRSIWVFSCFSTIWTLCHLLLFYACYSSVLNGPFCFTPMKNFRYKFIYNKDESSLNMKEILKNPKTISSYFIFKKKNEESNK